MLIGDCMRIGIDIDDTTFVTVKAMLKYGDIYDTEVVGGKGTNGNLGLITNRYYLKALYGWDVQTKFQFFDTYYKNILEESYPMENAASIINDLKTKGNEIYFITARLLNIKNCDTENITKNSLEKYHFQYDKLIINASDKLKFCLENKIDIFIEDSFDTCKELEEHGIKTFLMTTKMNENIDSGIIERVHNWLEVKEKINLYLNK